MKNSTTYGKRSKAALALTLGLSLFGGMSVSWVEHAVAQSAAERVSLVLPSIFQLTPGDEAVLPIQLKPASAVPRRAIVLVRGLPSTVTLSEGRLFESGVWGVPAADIGKVKMSAHHPEPGRNDVSRFPGFPQRHFGSRESPFPPR